MPIREIARRTGLSRNTIKKYLREDAVEPRFKTPFRDWDPIYSTSLAEGVSGVLVRDSEVVGGFVIHVVKDEPAVRQRFTAAHELGHFVLHKDLIGERVEDNYLLRSDGFSNAVEAEANSFAANLLMPRDQIAKAMEAGIRTPEQLAKAFGVSLTAMSIRLGLPT